MTIIFLESKTGKQYTLESKVLPRTGDAILLGDRDYVVKGVAHRFTPTPSSDFYISKTPVVSIELV